MNKDRYFTSKSLIASTQKNTPPPAVKKNVVKKIEKPTWIENEEDISVKIPVVTKNNKRKPIQVVDASEMLKQVDKEAKEARAAMKESKKRKRKEKRSQPDGQRYDTIT